MRASRETELLAVYPAKDVSSWLGNSAPVAMKHYAMATAESFERAAIEGAGPSKPKLHQKLHHSPARMDIQELYKAGILYGGETEKAANDVICGLVAVGDFFTSYPARTRTLND